MVLVEIYLLVVVENAEDKMIVDINTEKGVWERLPDGQIIKDCDKCENKCIDTCDCTPHTSKRDMEKIAQAKQDIIDELTKGTNVIAHETLRRYFVTLSQYGYFNYEGVYRILALLMLRDFRQEFSCYYNKEDEAIIQRLLNCLYCSICAIPHPDYRNVNTTYQGKTKQDYINYYEDGFKGEYSDL